MSNTTEQIWKTAEFDAAQAEQLAAQTGLVVPVAAMCLARGHADAESVDRLQRPRLSDLTDPDLLPSMGRAVDRIWGALEANESIVIYGDYDVDGITSTSLLSRVLSGLGGCVATFLPDRESEGYGFSVPALERCLQQHDPALIITVDCGSCAQETVVAAQSRSIDVIVTDHHELAGPAAGALALINPKLMEDASLQTLAGVGVAFKLCHALVKHGKTIKSNRVEDLDLRNYLDLVAVGTVADVVPLTGENRIFVRHGLNRLQADGLPGLRALRKVAGIDGELDAYHIGFVLGPRLNAAGRLGSAQAALELLTTDDESRAGALAAQLDTKNRERREIERRIVDEAAEEIDKSFNPVSDFGLVVGRREWHAGVVGIVASRLVRRYGRPTVVIGFDDTGAGRGSCRGIKDFSLVEALQASSEHLLTFGGHAMAAGLSIHMDHLDSFRETFNRVCRTTLGERDLRPVIRIDGWLEPSQADMRLCEQLRSLRPYGNGNPSPVWGIQSLHVVGQPRVVGNGHLKLTLAGGGTQWDAIAFGMGERELPSGPLDVACAVEINHYMGRENVQLNLRDFRPAAS